MSHIMMIIKRSTKFDKKDKERAHKDLTDGVVPDMYVGN